MCHHHSNKSIADYPGCSTSDLAFLDESSDEYSWEAGTEGGGAGFIRSCDLMYLTYFPSIEYLYFVDSTVYNIDAWYIVNSTGPSGVDGNFVAIRNLFSWQLLAMVDGNIVLQDGDQRMPTEDQLWSIDGIDPNSCARGL